MTAPMALPIGDGGVSTTSSAAGRNAVSNSRRRGLGNLMIFLAAVICPRLQHMEVRVASVRADQFVVRTVLDDTPMLDGNDAIGPPNRGEPVSDNENRAPFANPPHVLLDD